MTRIRAATTLDCNDIQNVYLCAFPDGERQMVSTLAVNLLNQETNPETISLVALIDGAVVGHIAFSPVIINNNKSRIGYILAPLGVKPAYQKRQIGSKLIKSGMEQVSKMDVNIVFVYGDPKYYGQFGFNAEAASGYSPPYELQYPFGWQAVALNDGRISNSTAKIRCATPLCVPELW